MKKYIIGAAIGAAVMFGGYALAATKGTSGLSVVDRLPTESIVKVYDQDSNVICYVAENNEWNNVANGISCLKNN